MYAPPNGVHAALCTRVGPQLGRVLDEGAGLEAETEAAARYRGQGVGREVEDNARMRQRMWERGLGRGAREAVGSGNGPTGASENHSAYQALAPGVRACHLVLRRRCVRGRCGLTLARDLACECMCL